MINGTTRYQCGTKNAAAAFAPRPHSELWAELVGELQQNCLELLDSEVEVFWHRDDRRRESDR